MKLLPLLLPLLAAAPVTPKTLTYENVVITAVLPAGVGCGIRTQWGAIDFRHDGVTTRAYVMCATTVAELPRVGARCTLTVTVSSIEGGTPDHRASPAGAYAVDRMTCDPPVGAVPRGPEIVRGETVTLHGATIRAWGKEPMAGSGIFWFVRKLTVIDANGAEHVLHQTYFGKGEVPAPGSRCDVIVQHLSLRGMNAISGENESLTELDSVEKLSCPPPVTS